MRLRAENTDLQGEDIKKRMREINNSLEGWYPKGGRKSIRLFQISAASNWAVLPYQGGWLDQPTWVIDDFEQLLLLGEWHQLNLKLPDVKSKDLPVFGED